MFRDLRDTCDSSKSACSTSSRSPCSDDAKEATLVDSTGTGTVVSDLFVDLPIKAEE